MSNIESIEVLKAAIENVEVSGSDWRVAMINQVEAQNRELTVKLEEHGVFVS